MSARSAPPPAAAAAAAEGMPVMLGDNSLSGCVAGGVNSGRAGREGARCWQR